MSAELGGHKLVVRGPRGVGNLPTKVRVSVPFCSPFMGQHLSDGPRDLATLSFDLGGHSACR